MALKPRNLNSQIAGALRKSQIALLDVRVDRVLKLLSDQQLVTLAGDQPDSPGTISVESVDLPMVWQDARVQARVSELGQQGIAVTMENRRRSVAGMEFEVPVLTIRYQI